MADRNGEGDPSKKKTTNTGSVSRAMFGVGSVIDTHHEGGLKRRVENTLDSRLDRQSDANSGGGNQVEDRQVVVSEDGNEILTIVSGKIVDRQKRLPPGKR